MLTNVRDLVRDKTLTNNVMSCLDKAELNGISLSSGILRHLQPINTLNTASRLEPTLYLALVEEARRAN